MTIPSRIIEGIYSSELKAEDYYSTYGKENIQQALEDIKKSNMEILNKYTPEDMKAAVMAKRTGKVSFKAYKIVTYAAAAVFIAAIAIPVGLTSYKSRTPAAATTVRLKGDTPIIQEANLFVYRQNGSEIHSLENEAVAKEGDVLQITYQAGNNEYGIIFSVDGNGNITRHYPENSWTAAKLKHSNEEIPLDFSYELDNAPNFEYFIMVGSQNQFSLENIENKIKHKTDINYLQKHSFFPKKTEVKTFLIKK